jgi:hypothetical protein
MTASAANGFAQVKFAPKPSTACKKLPYDFHPMYSTSSEKTRVTWAAHSYNVAFSDEIGHFDTCTGPTPVPATQFGTACPAGNFEGVGPNREKTDKDDIFCFPPSRSSRYPVPGCTFTNSGFDGLDYQPVWPDGNTALHPTPIRFSSPMTGSSYNIPYNRSAFEADLPAVEATCNVATGAGCTLIPQTDDGLPADFYPFFSTTGTGASCVWQFGNHIPGSTNDFGQNGQYGTKLQLSYTITGGKAISIYEDFRHVFSTNPCP